MPQSPSTKCEGLCRVLGERASIEPSKDHALTPKLFIDAEIIHG